MSLREVDISRLASELGELLMASEPGRRALITVAPGLTALADPTLLRCVLDNLMRNAWKFGAKKELTRIQVNGFVHDEDPAFFVLFTLQG